MNRKIILSILIMAEVFLCWSLSVTAQSKLAMAEYYYKQAKELYEYDKFDAAITVCTKAIEINPDYFEAYNLRGQAFLGARNYEAAINDLNKAISLQPSKPEPYLILASVYNAEHNYQETLKNYALAIERNPGEINYYFWRADVFREHKDYQSAINDYSRIIKIHPKDLLSEAYEERGWVYYLTAKYEPAARDLTEAIRLKPNYAPLYMNRATVYSAMGKTKLSDLDWKRAERVGQ